jgi:hypothetical protein
MIDRNADDTDKADLHGFWSLALPTRFARGFSQGVEGVKELKRVIQEIRLRQIFFSAAKPNFVL